MPARNETRHQCNLAGKPPTVAAPRCPHAGVARKNSRIFDPNIAQSGPAVGVSGRSAALIRPLESSPIPAAWAIKLGHAERSCTSRSRGVTHPRAFGLKRMWLADFGAEILMHFKSIVWRLSALLSWRCSPRLASFRPPSPVTLTISSMFARMLAPAATRPFPTSAAGRTVS